MVRLFACRTIFLPPSVSVCEYSGSILNKTCGDELCAERDPPWRVLEEQKRGTLVMLIKKMEWKEKEGKLNEAEKVEQKLKPDSKRHWKQGALKVKHHVTWHTPLKLVADLKMATVETDGVKKIIPGQTQTLRATRGTKTLPGDQSSCPTCSLTFTVCTAL